MKTEEIALALNYFGRQNQEGPRKSMKGKLEGVRGRPEQPQLYIYINNLLR